MLLEILSGLRNASNGHIYYDGILKTNDTNSSDVMGYKRNELMILEACAHVHSSHSDCGCT